MDPVRLEIGDAVVYVEPSDVEVATNTDRFGTSESGISERMVDAYGVLKQIAVQHRRGHQRNPGSFWSQRTNIVVPRAVLLRVGRGQCVGP